MIDHETFTWFAAIRCAPSSPDCASSVASFATPHTNLMSCAPA